MTQDSNPNDEALGRVGASTAIGDAIRRAREARGLTQLQLASKARISERTLRDIEHRKGSPQPTTIHLLEEALGAERGTLLFRTLLDRDPRDLQRPMTEFLLKYYVEASIPGAVRPYTYCLDGTRHELVYFSKPEWSGLSIPLHRLDSAAGYEPKRSAPECPRSAKDLAARYFAAQCPRIEGRRPVYRLTGVEAVGDCPAPRFGAEAYEDFRLNAGLMREELLIALAAHEMSPDRLFPHRPAALPLRERMMPNRASLLALDARCCAGGVCTLTAVKATDDTHYSVFFARRTREVATNQCLLHVCPSGMHECPTFDSAEPWIAPSLTFWRELYEELLGGRSAQDVCHIKRGWVLGEPAMRWFSENPDGHECIMTSFGIEAITGQFLVNTLLRISDGSAQNLEWIHNYEQTVSEVRSNDPDRIQELIEKEIWCEEGLAAFIDGLLLLRARDPTRVRLPESLQRVDAPC